MKINQIIREKRKALSLTQEQVANYLGVSTPAVNKWEKGSAYPDITLLPALARLLKTDLNTLLSFQKDVTDLEINQFIKELDKTQKEQDFPAAFQKAMKKIEEYPGCDKLTASAILYLEGALFLSPSIDEPERYKEKLEVFYERLAKSEITEIRETATLMLLSYARNRKDFAKAEELLNSLPGQTPKSSTESALGFTFESVINKEEQLAILLQQQKKYAEAKRIWQRQILIGVTHMQNALLNLLEISLAEQNVPDADFYANLHETLIRQFDFPEWMRYTCAFEIAIETKDKEKCLSILKKLLPAMKKEWNPDKRRLYRDAAHGASSLLSERLLQNLCKELSEKDEYAFLRDCDGFQELMIQISQSQAKTAKN